MELYNKLPNPNELILVVSTSTNANIVFYWKHSEMEAYWADPEGRLTELNAFEKIAMGFTITEDASKRLRVELALPVHTDKTLYLVSNSDGRNQLMFQHPVSQKIFVLYEIYVDLSNKQIAKCYCRCKDVKDQDPYVEVFDVSMSFFSMF
jgi:hypothetical protein